MEYQYYILSNGIKIIHRPAKGNVSHCGLMVNTGSRDELVSESGMAHFIEHMIFKGTKKRRAYHVLSRIENAGGDLNAFTTKEETCIYASFLSPYYNQTLELFADVAFNSVFPQKEMDKEKDVIIDEINSYHDSPADLIYDEFEDLLFFDHPLGRNILGDIGSVERLKRNDIFRFIKRNYSTQHMVIASVGDIEFGRLIKYVEKYFSPISTKKNKLNRHGFNSYHPRTKTLSKDSYLTHAVIGNVGYSREHQNRMSLALLANLLGGSALNSRLNLSIREKHGYAYTVEASYQPYSDTGIFAIYVGSDKKHIWKCLQLIEKELQNLTSKKLGTIQLHRAKKQIIGQLAISYESKLNEMLGIAKSHLYHSPVKSTEQIVREIEQIDAGRLITVANEIFKKEMMSTLIYESKSNEND